MRNVIVNSYDFVFPSDSITRPANTTQYTADDAVSDATDDAHFTFGTDTTSGDGLVNSGLTKPNVNTGIITGAQIVSSANQSTKLDGELWLFYSDITAIADADPFTVTDAEIATRIGFIDFPTADWIAGNTTSGAGGNAICTGSVDGVMEFTLPFKSNGKGQIFGQLITRNTYTPVSGEIFTVILQVMRH